MSGRGSTGRGAGGGGGRGRGGRGRGGRGGNKRAPASASSNRPQPKQRSNVCFHFSKHGTCRLADKCKFVHEVATTNEAVENYSDASGAAGGPPPANYPASNAVMPMIPPSGFMPMTTAPSPMQQQQPVYAPEPAPAAAGETKKLSHITDKRFADLNISSESRRALSEVFKYEFMTSVQAETLPLILEQDRNDCLAKAKTGTGKTLAFMIPTIEKIKETMKNGRSSDVHCLVISPTRELAQQISSETEKLLTFHKPHLRKVVTCVGGNNKNKDVRALKGTTPIVVATPGRLLDHLQNSDLADRMANLDTLVLDEADQLLDMGFRPDIERILRLLQPSCQTRQTLLFSATIPNQ
ncbi:hypothetical protein ACHAXR_001462, partial [Thalassiosira sp. AJA248-18]